MCPSTSCRLCLCLGSKFKAMVNENGKKSEIQKISAKYFDPSLLTTVICVDCWQHIDDFHQFQESVFNAQSRICEIEIGPLVKLETGIMTRNDEDEKIEALVKFEHVTIDQDDHNNVRDDINTPIDDFADSIDVNPFSIDDEIPLNKYFETSISCVSSKEKLRVDDSTEDNAVLLNKYCTNNQLSGQTKESVSAHKTTHTKQTYYCPYCPRKCKFKQNIRRHVKMQHPKEILTYSNTEFEDLKIVQGNQTAQDFKCPYCPKKLKLKRSVHRHVKHFHPKEYVEYIIKPPTTIQDSLNSNSLLLNDEFSKNNAPAEDSQIITEKKDEETKAVNSYNDFPLSNNDSSEIMTISAYAEETSNRLRQDMEKKQTEYQCQHCPETFQEKEDFNQHFQHCHPTEFEIFSDYDGLIAKWEKELECYVCQNKFATFGLLNKHFKAEHAKDKCYILCCGLKLNYRLELVEHIQFHLDPNFFTCKVCGKRGVSSRNIKLHMRSHVQDPELQCKVCKKYFTHKSKLTLHSGIHITEKHYKCKVCGKGFSTELLQKKHELNFHRGSICEQCGKSFCNSNTLKQHQVFVHGEERDKFSCEICGSQFESKNTLYSHKRAFHVDDSKPYVCSVCGNRYVSEANLNSHKQTAHTTNRFKCSLCDKEFKQLQTFRLHNATHSSNRIQCPLCSSRFIHKTSIKRHLKICHAEEYSKANWQKKETESGF